MRKLDLGSGKLTDRYKNRGWITLDARPEVNAHYTAEIPPIPRAVKDLGKFDLVQGIHFWEHLYHWQACELAVEILEILKPGGKLILELPNLDLACIYQLGLVKVPIINNAPYQPDPRFLMWAIY